MAIHAIHTTEGSPMNETALCDDHVYGWSDHGYGMLTGADDAPENPEYTLVNNPENNDTECVACGATK